MKALKILNNKKEWEILFGTALNANLNLADLTNKDEAINNLGLRDIFVTKKDMLEGDPNTVDHSVIIQDYSARFVNDRQIAFWNSKMNIPISGIGYFPGNGNETFYKVTTYDQTKPTEKILVPARYVTYQVNENTMGKLGDTWIRYVWTGIESSTGIYIGNTGSFTGQFTWYAFYSNNS